MILGDSLKTKVYSMSVASGKKPLQCYLSKIYKNGVFSKKS